MNATAVTAGAADNAALPMPIPGYGLLTYDDTAKLLKTTTRHVERLVSRRQLRAVALGQGDKLPRIRPADLLEFIRDMEPIARDGAARTNEMRRARSDETTFGIERPSLLRIGESR